MKLIRVKFDQTEVCRQTCFRSGVAWHEFTRTVGYILTKLKPTFIEFYEAIIYGQKLNNYIGGQVEPKALTGIDELISIAKIDRTFDTIKNHLHDLGIKNIWD